jgi:amidase
MISFEEYAAFDATGLAEQIAKGEFTPSEALQAALARAETVNPKINAIVYSMADQAAKLATSQNSDKSYSALHGVPFLVKDLLADVKGVPTSSGSRFFKDYVPDHDSNLIARFKAAGLNIFGKTNTPEFGITPITDPELWGSSRNPWNLAHTPGGSSGGSAAAVSAGIVPMASGGDGGGSIRMPSSCCGLVGLKPTRGRTPTGPDRGDLWFGMAQEHVLSRTVRDSALALDLTAGPDSGTPNIAPYPQRSFVSASLRDPIKPLRIGYTSAPMLNRESHPDCTAGVEHTVNLLQDLGHQVEEAAPIIDRELLIFHFVRVVSADTAATIRMGGKLLGKTPTRADFETQSWAAKKLGDAFSATDVMESWAYLQSFGREMGKLMDKYDVWLTPSAGTPPLTVGGLKASGIDKFLQYLLATLPIEGIAKKKNFLIDAGAPIYDWMSYTPLTNITGTPSMSLPLFWNSQGLPIGSCFHGRFGGEETLFELAGQLERSISPFSVPSGTLVAGKSSFWNT